MSIEYVVLIILGVLLVGGLIVGGLVGLTFFLGWIRLGTERTDGNDEVTLVEDENRAERQRAWVKAREFKRRPTEQVTAPTENGKESVNTPAKQPQN